MYLFKLKGVDTWQHLLESAGYPSSTNFVGVAEISCNVVLLQFVHMHIELTTIGYYALHN